MNTIYRKIGDFIAQGKFERMQAENDALKARLDYVAMMSDIELPDFTEEENAQPEV